VGFRFSKRIKILPGINLNFSTRGISMSAGVRGARVNFGPRGVYATAGLPGTGISYRQRIDSPARRASAPASSPSLYVASNGRSLSLREFNARVREMERQERVEQAQAQVDEESDRLDRRVNFWRPLPAIPSTQEIQNARRKFPFQSRLKPPNAPDWDAEQRSALVALVEQAHRQWPYLLLPRFFARRKARKLFTECWPLREEQIQRLYTEAWDKYEQDLVREQDAWEIEEQHRVAWLERLLAGDMDEAHRTASEVVSALRFPFHTTCDVFLEDCTCVCLHVDLPEIEDTIPLTTKRVLNSGDMKEVGKDELSRNRLYGQLVFGEGIHLAATLFGYLPLLELVKVAGYTQRASRGATEPIDTYVFDLVFKRSAVEDFRVNEGDVFGFCTKQGGRFDLTSSFLLRRVEPPIWLSHDDVVRSNSA
jgi:hypothetical protein